MPNPSLPEQGDAVQRVLITGAAGRMGRMLRQHLSRMGRSLRFMDIVPVDEPDALVASVADFTAMQSACTGMDAIVHLGGTPVNADWDLIRETNIHGTYCVFEAARLAGIRRVIYASSNHVSGFLPNGPDLPDDLPSRPDGLYGVSKVFGEALGSLYHDRYGMDVVCLRIGTCYDIPPTDMRTLSTWLSPGDCARLIEAALTCPSPGFKRVWGISANTRNDWSRAGGEAIGFHPQDNAEDFAAQAVPDAQDEAIRGYVGGQFAL